MTLLSFWPCCHSKTNTSTIPINPFWQAASSCHDQDLLAVPLVRFNPCCKKSPMRFDLGKLQTVHPSRLEWLWSRWAGASWPPPEAYWHGYHILPLKNQYDLSETTLFLFGLFKGISEHRFSNALHWVKRHHGLIRWPPQPGSVANIWTNWALLIWRAIQATDTLSVDSLLLQECVPLTLPGVWRAVKKQLKMTTDSMHNELNMVYVLLLT